MITKYPYYHIYSATMTGCDLTKDAYVEARRTWLCSGCGSPKPGVREIDARVQNKPGKEALNGVGGCGIPMIRNDRLESFGREVIESDLYIGRVYGPDSRELTDWVTVRGRNRLIVRGTKNPGARRCTECGRDVYFAMNKKFLYPAPPSNVCVFESHTYGLVLRKDLFLKAEVEKWRGIWIDPLRISDEPEDGLGQLFYE